MINIRRGGKAFGLRAFPLRLTFLPHYITGGKICAKYPIAYRPNLYVETGLASAHNFTRYV